jgi:uncharacterized membrane protein YdbT with pleckstrin-like domain
MKEEILYESHPLMFRNNPIGFTLSILAIPLYGTGLFIFLYWWLKVKGTKITLTDERTTLRKGILSKNINEVYHADVRNVKVSQSLSDRMFKVGVIGISTAGQADVEILVGGIPNPEKAKSIIDQKRKAAK